ncbi:MAG: acylphosphatase [Nitrospinota bacterium]
MDKVCKKILIRGLVQGVFFRATCYEKANSIGGLSGYVKNLPSGEVEALIQGPTYNVKQLIEFLHIGPKGANVDEVIVDDALFRPDLKDFSIIS